MRTGKKLPWFFRRSLRRVDHVVANSHEAARILAAEYVVPRETISVIHNSLVFPPTTVAEPSTASTDRLALRAQLGAGAETVVLLCVAMLRPEKNQRELIEIAAQLPADLDWQLWIAGDGTARADCEQLAARLQLGDKAKFLGFAADAAPLYRSADLAVLTSKAESLSNFLIEAHAHALPSVAYQAGGVAECGGTTVALGDQRAFLRELVPLMRTRELRQTRGAAVSTLARAQFSTEAQMTAYESLFSRLLSD